MQRNPLFCSEVKLKPSGNTGVLLTFLNFVCRNSTVFQCNVYENSKSQFITGITERCHVEFSCFAIRHDVAEQATSTQI